MSGPPISLGQLTQRFLGRLRFPQLFVVAAVLFAIDVVVPDVIPFLDEIMLAVLTVLLSQWKKSESPADNAEEKPPTKNVTPQE